MLSVCPSHIIWEYTERAALYSHPTPGSQNKNKYQKYQSFTSTVGRRLMPLMQLMPLMPLMPLMHSFDIRQTINPAVCSQCM